MPLPSYHAFLYNNFFSRFTAYLLRALGRPDAVLVVLLCGSYCGWFSVVWFPLTIQRFLFITFAYPNALPPYSTCLLTTPYYLPHTYYPHPTTTLLPLLIILLTLPRPAVVYLTYPYLPTCNSQFPIVIIPPPLPYPNSVIVPIYLPYIDSGSN